MRKLAVEPLEAAVFAPYGEVIEVDQAREQRTINYGHTLRYHDLARLDLNEQEGRSLVSIFRSTPLPRPIGLRVMERHPLSSQAFIPLSGRPYLVVVAGMGPFEVGQLRAFLAQPHQGVNYRRGCWHHYSLALEAPSDFLVIDREGPGDNCQEVFLEDEVVLDC